MKAIKEIEESKLALEMNIVEETESKLSLRSNTSRPEIIKIFFSITTFMILILLLFLGGAEKRTSDFKVFDFPLPLPIPDLTLFNFQNLLDFGFWILIAPISIILLYSSLDKKMTVISLELDREKTKVVSIFIYMENSGWRTQS